MASRKSVTKSAAKRTPPKPFKPGPDPRRGKGPKKGAPNAGRPRDEWKARLQAMASSDAVLDHVEQTLTRGPTDPFFQRALDYVTDHGYGRATQSIELSGTVNIAEKLQAARDRALNRSET